MLDEHAYVLIDGVRIPLIGIKPTETQDTCDLCHDIFHLSQLEWTDNELLCKKCRAQKTEKL